MINGESGACGECQETRSKLLDGHWYVAPWAKFCVKPTAAVEFKKKKRRRRRRKKEEEKIETLQSNGVQLFTPSVDPGVRVA